MSKKTKGIPEGFHTITPYLILKDAAKAIKFYQEAFDAKEVEISHAPDGRVLNAAIKIGDSLLMISDEFPEYDCGVTPPETLKGTTAMLHIYVEDADAAFDKAIKAGAKVKMPLDNMFWGDRYGQLEDPFGHVWSIATQLDPLQVQQDCCHKSTSCCQ